MPKPPESGVYGLVRGHRPRSAAGEYPQPTASLLSEINFRHVTVSETNVKDVVTVFMTPRSDDCLPADNALNKKRRFNRRGTMSVLFPR